MFTAPEEDALAKYILTCSKMFHGLSRDACRQLAFEYAQVNNKKFPSSWKTNSKAGKDWFYGFLRQQSSLSLRLPEATSLARSIAFNKSNVQLFFYNLKEVLERNSYQSHQIWNLDETGITTVQRPPKVIAEKGAKQVGQITSFEQGTLVTMCCCVNAVGQSIPPAYIFPRVYYKAHMLNGAPNGSLGLACQSGWMTNELFVDVFKHFLTFMKPSISNPALLVMDNHKSHLSAAVVDLARNHGVTIITFPPHCNHRLQPLDVSVYGPFKTYFNCACQEWMLSNAGQPLTIYNLASLSSAAYYRAFTPSNITSGFKKTGIVPLDENIFPKDVFLSSMVTDQRNSSLEDENRATSPAPNNDLAVSINDVPGTSGTTGTIVTPEDVRPYPKAVRRKRNSNRKKVKSTIITDSSAKSSKSQPQKKNAAKQPVESSSESESEPPVESDSEVGLTDTSDDEHTDVTDGAMKEGAFVLVVYEGKRKVHFVGQILKEEDEDGELEIKFLRKHPKVYNGFIEPPVEDIHSVPAKTVKLVLPQPFNLSGSTKRAMGIKKFHTDFSAYDM